MHRHTDRQGISARNAQTTTDREQDKVEMLTLQIKLVKYIPRGWLADFFGHLSCSSLSSRIFFSATIFARKKVERGFAIVPMATTQWKIKQKKKITTSGCSTDIFARLSDQVMDLLVLVLLVVMSLSRLADKLCYVWGKCVCLLIFLCLLPYVSKQRICDLEN